MSKWRESISRCSLLLAVLCGWLSLAYGQQAHPIKVPLRRLGNPQFPTAFWLTPADPNFRHSGDALFWLDSDTIATTFFQDFCCRSGNQRGARYGAAFFNAAGKLLATHDWTATPDRPFRVGGIAGAFWTLSSDNVVLLGNNFAERARIAVPKRARVIWSKSGHGVAVQDGTEVDVYDVQNPGATARMSIAADALVEDVYGDAILLDFRSKACQIEIKSSNSWTPAPPDGMEPGRCPSAIALVSPSEALIAYPEATGQSLAIVRAGGSTETIPYSGQVIGTANSGRLALVHFQPNPVAEAFDMDFGGHKQVIVYNIAGRSTAFQRTFGSQAGAALSPDGKHLAVIDRHSLLIYTLPAQTAAPPGTAAVTTRFLAR